MEAGWQSGGRVVDQTTTTYKSFKSRRGKMFSDRMCKYLPCLGLSDVTVTHLIVVTVCMNN